MGGGGVLPCGSDEGSRPIFFRTSFDGRGSSSFLSLRDTALNNTSTDNYCHQ